MPEQTQDANAHVLVLRCSECESIAFYELGEDTYWGGEDEEGYELEIMTSIADAVKYLTRAGKEHMAQNGQEHRTSLYASPPCAEEAAQHADGADGGRPFPMSN